MIGVINIIKVILRVGYSFLEFNLADSLELVLFEPLEVLNLFELQRFFIVTEGLLSLLLSVGIRRPESTHL